MVKENNKKKYSQAGFTRTPKFGVTPKGGGFTLIEAVIYIALFAFIMASALVSVYSLLGGSARNLAKAMVQEEGSFLLGKIDWVLGGTKSASVSPTVLTATKFDATVVTISVSGEKMFIQKGASAPQELNNSNVRITCPDSVCFTHTLASGDGIKPESVEAEFTVNTLTSEGLPFSQDFSTIKYLRK